MNEAKQPSVHSADIVLGSSLERLWGFARLFQTRPGTLEVVIDDLDEGFKRRVWKHLLTHREIIVQSGSDVIYSNQEAQENLAKVSLNDFRNQH